MPGRGRSLWALAAVAADRGTDSVGPGNWVRFANLPSRRVTTPRVESIWHRVGSRVKELTKQNPMVWATVTHPNGDSTLVVSPCNELYTLPSGSRDS